MTYDIFNKINLIQNGIKPLFQKKKKTYKSCDSILRIQPNLISLIVGDILRVVFCTTKTSQIKKPNKILVVFDQAYELAFKTRCRRHYGLAIEFLLDNLWMAQLRSVLADNRQKISDKSDVDPLQTFSSTGNVTPCDGHKNTRF